MFNSLDEEMKRDERQQSTLAERVLQYIAVLFFSAAAFGALYTGILLLE
jgi:formate-dependent nitrite reductase membrane component NrfD